MVAVLLFFTPAASAQKPDGKADKKPATNVIKVELPTSEQRSPAATFVVELSPADAGPGDVVTATVKVTVAPGWHIYPESLPRTKAGIATEIQLKAPGLEPVGKKFAASRKPDAVLVDSRFESFYTGTVSFTRKYRVSKAGLKKATGYIRFQACDDEKCLPPTKLTFDLAAPVRKARRSTVVTAKPTFKTMGTPVTVSLQECKGERPPVKISLVGLLLFGPEAEKLALKGKFSHKGHDYPIYLPKSRRYLLKNTGHGETWASNTATYASVDYDSDGKLTEPEAVATNRPIRFGDDMFQITSIDKDGKKLTIQQVAAPLSGSVIGQKIVPFKLTTTDGKTITDKSILGKVTLLDIWAVT